jgi:hypothetical protein
MVKSNRKGKAADSAFVVPAQTNGNLIPLLKALIIVVSSTESCGGLLIDFRKPRLWGNETRVRSLEFDTFFSSIMRD